MFKEFSLNKDFSFDLLGRCRFRNEYYEDDGSGKVVINIGNRPYSFCRKWLGLITHYEVNLPIEEMCLIYFVNCESKVINLNCKAVMHFRKPIERENGFRVIPGYTNFLVNREGVVKSLISGKVLKNNFIPYEYPATSIYDPDRGKWRRVYVHILVAKAFVRNPDPFSRFYVNHKDGNKGNLSPDNLEWVTSRSNQTHAIKSGLRKDNNPCRIRDVLNGTVKSFPSVAQAFESVGLKLKSTPLYRRVDKEIIPILHAGRYEIKLDTDKSDWFFNKDNLHLSRKYSKGPFQALNIETKEVIEAVSLAELSRILSIGEHLVNEAYSSPEPKVTNGYYFRAKSTEPWPKDFVLTKTRPIRKFRLVDQTSNEVLIFESLRKTINYLGIDKRTFKRRLALNIPVGKYLIEEILI